MSLLIIAILIGLIPAAIAKNKGRSFIAWWIYGAALFIVALPHALLIKPDQVSLERQKMEEGMKKCPFCAEMIRNDAIVCRYCGREFFPDKTISPTPNTPILYPEPVVFVKEQRPPAQTTITEEEPKIMFEKEISSSPTFPSPSIKRPRPRSFYIIITVLTTGLIIVFASLMILKTKVSSSVNEALIQSAEKGDEDTVKALLAKGANVNARNKDGAPVLIIAATKGYTTIVQTLIEKGADINKVVDKISRTALMEAAIGGHKATVQALLEKGAKVNEKDFLGSTALSLAANHGHTVIVQMLIDKGAEINARDNLIGGTPLMSAATFGHTATVQTLLANGAEVDAKNKDGLTALMIAAYGGHNAVVKALLNKGADVSAKNKDGKTAFDLAEDKGHMKIAQLLRNASTKETISSDSIGMSEKKEKDTFIMQSPQGVETNLKPRGSFGSTNIIGAAMDGNTTEVQSLLAQGADVNGKDKDGKTALMYAAREGHIETLQILLVQGANVHAKDKNGRTALMFAVTNGHITIVQTLLDKGADVNSKDNDGKTVLMRVVEKGHLATVQALLARGVDINVQEEKYGNSALIIAIFKKHKAIVQVLLAKGADVNVRDKSGRTALKWAVKEGLLEIVELLKNAGAKE